MSFNIYYLISGMYSSLKPLPKKYNWMLSPFRFLLRQAAYRILPHYFESSKFPFQKYHGLEKKVIVSLTSFPKRINYVWLTIQSLMRQTVQPDKIILWLSQEQFDSIDCLPEKLKSLRGEIFEIRLVKKDYRSHKKYLYAFTEFPDDCVVLVDDDIIYNYNLLEKLTQAHKLYPDRVICNFGSVIRYDNDMILSDAMWQNDGSMEPDNQNIFFGTGGGSLFVPSLLYSNVLDIVLARRLTPLADDVWLNAMTRLAGVRTYFLNLGPFLPQSIEDDETLFACNIVQNDVQIRNVIEYYKKTIGRDPFSKRME